MPYSISVSLINENCTAEFRVKDYKPTYEIHNKGISSFYHPELILKNFNTGLGRRTGRLFASMFRSDPEFKGWTVVTFHN